MKSALQSGLARCEQCDYLLVGLSPAGRCPECGAVYDADRNAFHPRQLSWPFRGLIAGGAALATYVGVLIVSAFILQAAPRLSQGESVAWPWPVCVVCFAVCAVLPGWLGFGVMNRRPADRIAFLLFLAALALFEIRSAPYGGGVLLDVWRHEW